MTKKELEKVCYVCRLALTWFEMGMKENEEIIYCENGRPFKPTVSVEIKRRRNRKKEYKIKEAIEIIKMEILKND